MFNIALMIAFIMIYPWFISGYTEFTNVFACANLLDDINYTISMFHYYEHKASLSVSEKYYITNLSCSAVTVAKEELNDDLCALELDPLILDRRNDLQTSVDEKIALFCDKDFSTMQSKCT